LGTLGRETRRSDTRVIVQPAPCTLHRPLVLGEDFGGSKVDKLDDAAVVEEDI
jgi:hypothetical protein